MRKTATILFAVLISFLLSTDALAVPKGAVLIDEKNGRVLFEINKDEKLPMASTTKIMTALITLEQESIDEYFLVDKKSVTVEGSSMGLLAGDKVTLRTLAIGMLLASGNDAANAAAIKISGSTESFAELMNRRAKEMGLKNTSFETPSGLDGDEHFSTAYDMAILAQNALNNPDFAEICGSKTMSVEYGNPPYMRTLTNHNRLLGVFDGATGVKTGFTKKSGRCLVSSAEREGVSLICVTLNCFDDWNYHTAIYNEYFDKLKSVPLEELVDIVEIPVCGGSSKTVKAVPKEVSAALFDGEFKKVEVILSIEQFIFAPVSKGKILGKASFYIDEVLIAQTPLVANENIASVPVKNDFWNKIKDII